MKLGRTVAELRASLSNAEWVRWCTYYARKGQAAELRAKSAAGRQRRG